MKLISRSEILVDGNRQRTKWDDGKIEELQKSIKKLGLMHPIVVQPYELMEYKYRLIAGFRRWTATDTIGMPYICDGQVVGKGMVPTTVMVKHGLEEMEVLSDNDYYAAELMENLMREDLSAVDKAAAVAELHRRREEERGVYDRSTGEGHTKKDTAEELSTQDQTYHSTRIADDLLIDEYKDYPTVMVAKNRREALRAIREIKRGQERKQKLDDFIGKDGGERDGVLWKGNCLEYKPDVKFGQIIADPPYGIDIDKVAMSDDQYHEYDDSYDSWKELMGKFPQWCWDNTADKAFVWVFCDYSRFTEMLAAFMVAGFDPWRRPLIWDKKHIGGYGNMVTGFRTNYECILFANKGKKQMENPQGEVFSVVPEMKEHPAGKPAELYRKLLNYGAMPGDYVCDPFCGSGTIFQAVREKGELKHKLDLIPHGVEMSDKYYDMALEVYNETA